MEPPVPYNEVERLQVLNDYHILDTPPEERFDAIVREAASRCNAPIALFSLVDENRQWFKSRVGLDVQETDRALSFCAHAVANDAPLVIGDTLKDSRFVNNELVVGHPYIRFYAGIPVRANSKEPLGTLCIIDSSPRSLPWEDFRLMQRLALQIESQLERGIRPGPVH